MSAGEILTVVKIGGNIIDNPARLDDFIGRFVNDVKGPKILVHGGGKEATRLSAALEIPTTMIEGRRVTDGRTIEVVTMVYAGLINKRVVAKLQASGCDAIGLCGADGDVIRARRRNPEPIDYGFVGDIDPRQIDCRFISKLIDMGKVPVFCAITHDGAGNLLNCNADSVATSVAVAMASVRDTRLCMCFEKRGVMRDVDDPDSVIAELTPDMYAELRASGAVNQGMIPKIDNAFSAIDRGVKSVMIMEAGNLSSGIGTVIRK